MKKIINILNSILYYLCLPFAGIIYVIVDGYRDIKRRIHRNHLNKIGRASEANPYTDKW